MTAALILACVLTATRAALALLLGIAAIGKLRQRARWHDALAAYRLLPDILLAPVALALPIAELATAAGLVAGVAPAGIAAALLLLVFAGAMAVNLLRGRRALDCGCNPAARPQPISWALVARNTGLAGLAVLTLVPVTPLPGVLMLAAAFAGLVAWLLLYAIALLQGLTLKGAR